MRARAAGVVAVLLALAAPATASAAPVTRPCPDDRAVRCGTIAVPLLRGAPDDGGRKLRGRFRAFPRDDGRQRRLGRIVAAEGGLGSGSIGSVRSCLFMLGSLRKRHDMIVMDSRGTGRSGAINC